MHATIHPVQTRFRSGSGLFSLNLATYIKSPIHDAKGTESRVALAGHSAFPACRHTISGSFDSPHRGPFHLSLAVLVHYRSTGSIQAYGMVPADSGRIARVPPYLGFPLGSASISATGLSPSMARLSRRLAYRELVLNAVPLPRQSFLWRFGLLRFRSPLLAESHLLSFPRGTEMFHFPRFAPLHL